MSMITSESHLNSKSTKHVVDFLVAIKGVLLLFFLSAIAHSIYRYVFPYLLNAVLGHDDMQVIEKTYYVTQSAIFSYVLMPTLFTLISFIFSKGHLYQVNLSTLCRFIGFIMLFYLLLVIFHLVMLMSTRIFLEWAYVQQRDIAIMLTTIARGLSPVVAIPLLALILSPKNSAWQEAKCSNQHYRTLNIILFSLLGGALASVVSGPIFWLANNFYVFVAMLVIPSYCAYKLFPTLHTRVEVKKIVLSIGLYVSISMLVFPFIFSFFIRTIPYMLYLHSFPSLTIFMYVIMFLFQYVVCRKSIKLFFYYAKIE